MPEVGVVVELQVTVDGDLDSVVLEHAVAAEGRRGAKKLYRQALRLLDERTTGAS